MPKGSFSIFHHGDKFFMLKSLIKNFPDRSAMPTLVFSSLADEILEAWLRANLAFANVCCGATSAKGNSVRTMAG
jgi:hypothetical protein